MSEMNGLTVIGRLCGFFGLDLALADVVIQLRGTSDFIIVIDSGLDFACKQLARHRLERHARLARCR